MFPKRLKTIREERNLSRSQLASILGVTKAAITRWELGMREPKFEMLVKLCDVLDVSSDHLLGRTSDRTLHSEVAKVPGQDMTDKDV